MVHDTERKKKKNRSLNKDKNKQKEILRSTVTGRKGRLTIAVISTKQVSFYSVKNNDV